MADLKTNLLGFVMNSPVIGASGTVGYGVEYEELADFSKIGGISGKGLTLHGQYGNKGERLWETPSGLINSIGLQNPGVESFIENDLPWLLTKDVAVIANITGTSVEQYVQMALQYLRMEKMTSDLVFARYDLDALIRQAVRKYAPLFIRRKIILSYEPVHCEVLTDEKWLVFVLEQILSNALKYTKSGSIHIYLSPDAPKTLVIEDTGIGIAPEDLPRIFEKGYTGCNGRADKRSTGIGLYLCRQIMEKLSHTIRIESEMGVGTKVYLGLDTVSL